MCADAGAHRLGQRCITTATASQPARSLGSVAECVQHVAIIIEHQGVHIHCPAGLALDDAQLLQVDASGCTHTEVSAACQHHVSSTSAGCMVMGEVGWLCTAANSLHEVGIRCVWPEATQSSG
jgi:hypothetical protein